ncbi:MAG: aminopeptidase [Promethearchaeota archaeon]|jgi:aminopeptidase
MSSEFEENLEKYADVIVKVGLNLQPGQRLIIGAPIFSDNFAPIELFPLVRLIVKKAYQSGANFVDVMWTDDHLRLLRYKYAPRDSFEEFPSWRTEMVYNMGQSGEALIVIYAENPDLLNKEDPDLIAITQQTAVKHMEPIMDLVVQNRTNWSVVTAPVKGWVDKLFPNLPPEKREKEFWNTIFKICRVNNEDPVLAWREHIQQLAARSVYLNQKHYSSLHFTGGGTDLMIGLPERHVWRSGSLTSQNDITFAANIPTEEVFTIPHKDKTEGVLIATKPLYYSGSLVEDYQLTFSKGKVVEFVAKNGQDHLDSLIKIDEGASYLGEIALVPHSSPISQSGLLFYNILIDENASDHIALGRGYKFSLKEGESLSDEDFAKLGGNHSLIHIDCMFGSSKMEVNGILENGTIEPIMRNGEWAFNI